MKNPNLEENVKDRIYTYSLTELKSFIDGAKHMMYYSGDRKWTRIHIAAQDLLKEKMINIVDGL